MNDLKEQWAEIPDWQKLVLIIAAGFFVMYGIFFMLIQPKKENIKKLSQEVATLETQVNTLKRYTSPAYIKRLENETAQIKKEISKLKSELKKIEKIIPPDKNIDQVLSYISFSANKSKMDLERFKVSQEKIVFISYDKNSGNLKVEHRKNSVNQNQKSTKKVMMKEIDIDLALKGNVKKLKKFLISLSKSKRYISVDNIHIVKGETGLNSILKLKTLYLPED